MRAGGPGLCVQPWEFARAAAAKCHEAPGLEQRTFAVSRLWRLEVQSQCLGRAVLPLKPVGQALPLLPWLGGSLGRSLAYRLVTPILPHTAFSPRPLSDTSLSVSKFSLFLRIRTHPKHLILTWPHLQKLNFQRPHSKVLGLGLQHIFGGRGLFNPRHHTARSPPAGFLLGEAITWIKPLS